MSIDKTQLDSLRIERPREETRASRPWIAIFGAVFVAVGLILYLFARPHASAVRVAPARAVVAQSRTAVLNASGYVTARRQATVSSKVT
ncbi:MAG: efflux RND transporter periplasmic adaptor subunit, partial [Thermoanaerobaculia bacterium]